MGKNNEIDEELAEEITNANVGALLDELDGEDASEEEKIKESLLC